MGLGDEIMALGEAEAAFEKHGVPVAICDHGGQPRDHEAWHGSPAWDKDSLKKIQNCSSRRPYIIGWRGRRAVYNPEFRARAGKIYLTEEEKAFNKIEGDYVVVAPNLKKGASPNKDWGKWQSVIDGISIPVYQLVQDDTEKKLNGVNIIKTNHFKKALSIIAGANLVLCNEGGSHHMAASMGIPAVVIFGSFISPDVTGYNIHANITVKDAHYCGNFDKCSTCKVSLESIPHDVVLSLVREFLNGKDISGIHRI